MLGEMQALKTEYVELREQLEAALTGLRQTRLEALYFRQGPRAAGGHSPHAHADIGAACRARPGRSAAVTTAMRKVAIVLASASTLLALVWLAGLTIAFATHVLR
jgi:hypothetical protein